MWLLYTYLCSILPVTRSAEMCACVLWSPPASIHRYVQCVLAKFHPRSNLKPQSETACSFAVKYICHAAMVYISRYTVYMWLPYIYTVYIQVRMLCCIRCSAAKQRFVNRCFVHYFRHQHRYIHARTEMLTHAYHIMRRPGECKPAVCLLVVLLQNMVTFSKLYLLATNACHSL